MPSLLETVSLRIDVAGCPAIDRLSLSSTGEWVLVLGAARALFEAAAGVRAVQRGEIRVEGSAPREAIGEGAATAAPLDPPLPARWTASQYTRWSARLAGHAADVSRSLSFDALARLDLDRFANVRISAMTAAVRRATVLAAALATGAGTLLVEDPLADLEPESGRRFARAIVRALGGRRVVFFAARVALESPVGLAADEAIVVDGSEVAQQGAPAELAANERRFALRIAGDAAAFAAAVCAAGATLLAPAEASTPAYVRLEAGPLATRDVLRIALESRAVVLEMRPIARAFA